MADYDAGMSNSNARVVGSLIFSLGVLAVASCETTGGAHDVKVQRRAGTRAAQAEVQRLHDDVAWLADDARDGRRSGTEGCKVSGEWIARRCAELGLQPAGENGFLQPFSVPLPVELGPNTRVSWSDALVGVQSETKGVQPMFCSSGGEARGEIEWRGYGMINGEKGWNDYETRCDGKVVLIVRGTPPLPPASETPSATENPHGNVQEGDGWGNSGSLFLKVMNAKKNGAVAVLVAPHPDQAEEPLPPFDHSRAAQSGIPALFVSGALADYLCPAGRSQLAAVAPPETAPIEGEDLDARAKIEARYREFLRNHELVRTALSPREVPVQVAVVADVRREKGTAENVLARLPGRDSSRVVIVGAHYDHLGRGGDGSLAPGEHGEIHNGADDNASGTAAVLEMARLLAAGPQPECDVVFALWAGEELGLLGSEHWAEHPTLPLASVVANLNLDMVGRAGNGKLSVIGAGSSAPFDAWLREAAAGAGLELSISASGQGIGGSDHQTFLKRQIPALHFFSGVHADYHKPTDDLERFEAAGAARVADLGVALIERLCGARELAWIEPPAPTEQPQRVGAPFRVWFGTVPDYGFEGPGLRLTGTSPGSPAEKAGMLAGDVLVQVGDVAIENINDFMYALQIYKPGDVVLSRYLRDGAEESVRVTLSTRDAQ